MPQVTITTNPEVVEFDPALPPAACSVLPASQFIERTTIQQGLNEQAARELHDPPCVYWGTGNCGFNQTYNDNMVAMAAAGENVFDLTDNLSVSDTDYEHADDQITLGLKIIDPTWKDLKPAMQLQIATALLKIYNWDNMCIKLDIIGEDRANLSRYLNTRSQQIYREDQALAKMREQQLTHLMGIDQSILRRNEVPHQLVLRKISRQYHNRILEITDPELEFCRADDILAARQFLRQHDLSEKLAGEWASPMVELSSKKQTETLSFPEKFQWKDNWTLPMECYISPHGPIRDCAPGPSFNALPSFAKSMCSKGGSYLTINPRDLIREDIDNHPLKTWKEHTPFYQRDKFLEARKRVREKNCKRETESVNISEYTRLRVGSKQEARLSFAYRNQPFDRLIKLARDREAQNQATHTPHVPLPLHTNESPSRLPKGTQVTSHLQDSPVTRSLGGCWSLNDIHPSESQHRYERQIDDAKREREKQAFRGEAQPQFIAAELPGTLSPMRHQTGFSDRDLYINIHDGVSDIIIEVNDVLDSTKTFACPPNVQLADHCVKPQLSLSPQISDNGIFEFIDLSPDAEEG
ncbi:hypothetical protein VI817_005621 [Penicillium citrinum]|nr:hypothetical protein VI817_005621 [Penicillium citrinum]